MKSRTTFFALIALTSSTMVSAEEDPRFTQGPFIDLSAGTSVANFDSIGLVEIGDVEADGTASKLNAGYWFSDNWGVAVNIIDLGDFEQRYETGTFRGEGKSYGMSLLGRIPIATRWSLIGKINVTRTKLTDNGSVGGGGRFEQLRDESSSVVLPGLELHYHLNDNATVFLDADPRGEAGKRVDLGYLGVGVRYRF